MGLFKKKKQIEIETPKELPILIQYIQEARNLMWGDKEIENKFKQKNYPEELISQAFEEANKLVPLKKIERRKKIMAKKEEDYEDEEDFEEEEDEEDFEEDGEEEDEEKPVKKKKDKKKKETTKTTETKPLTNEQLTSLIQQVVAGVRNQEERLTNIEAAFFKLKNI